MGGGPFQCHHNKSVTFNSTPAFRFRDDHRKSPKISWKSSGSSVFPIRFLPFLALILLVAVNSSESSPSSPWSQPARNLVVQSSLNVPSNYNDAKGIDRGGDHVKDQRIRHYYISYTISKLIVMIVLIFLLTFGGAYISSATIAGSDEVSGNGISCLDHYGNKISWSITYKLPKVRGSSNPRYRQGSGYTLITPTATQQWIEVDDGIDNETSIIGRTLKPLYTNDTETAFFVYNDQPPAAPTIPNNGHTKGVILTNANGGIWLIHSVPHFPSLTSHRYSFPTTGYMNGQIFLCLTLNVTQVDGIAEVLTYTRPNIFNYTIPKSLSTLLPNLSNLVKSRFFRLRSPPWFKLIQLKVDRLEFLIFAKGPKFHREIYADWIAPTLESSLNVQSWLNGPNPLSSNCSSNFTVRNILLKALDDQDFSSHSDHSKWAVGTTNQYACIGDLNRMEHQMVRGGALLCTKDAPIWNLLSNSITEIQPCPRKRRWF